MELNPGYLLKFLLLYQEIRFLLTTLFNHYWRIWSWIFTCVTWKLVCSCIKKRIHCCGKTKNWRPIFCFSCVIGRGWCFNLAILFIRLIWALISSITLPVRRYTISFRTFVSARIFFDLTIGFIWLIWALRWSITFELWTYAERTKQMEPILRAKAKIFFKSENYSSN